MKSRRTTFASLLVLFGLLGGCANPALREAEELRRGNQLPEALRLLDSAVQADPKDLALRAAQARTREQLIARLVMQIEGLRATGRWGEARDALQRLREADARHPRLAWLEGEIERGRRLEARLLVGRGLLRDGKLDRADALAREILAESPQHPGARLLLSQAAQARPLDAFGIELGGGLVKPVTLEFREAPLRQVFEALARSTNVNFVFDKDVRSDAKVTVFLRGVSLDEAMRVILSTQGLDRKLLNENSVFVFPNTAAKQREHQELITRTLYLNNTNVKQVQEMLRTIAKVRDIYIDERLNLMIVRDTPEVVRLVEKLIATMDLPDPEVMLEVEVMEISADKADAIGLQWPDTLQYGLPAATGATNSAGQVLLGQRGQFRASIANPALVATLRGTSGNANLLANPKIRVRNRDKAKVQIGQKVPVFTTTANFNVTSSVATTVTYLDVGLKLEVEPTVLLDNEVSIKVGLEVNNLIRQVSGPGGSIAYEIGTRQTSTALRLADGETQVLAGLINDEDRRSAAGVPELSGLPLLGKLFGVQSDSRNKTEVVLLITPRVVRNLALPEASATSLPGGTDASPGALSSLLRPLAKSATLPRMEPRQPAAPAAMSENAAKPEGAANAAPQAAASTATEAAANAAILHIDVTPQIPAGGVLSVSLRNDNAFAVKGELGFDATRVQAAQAPVGGSIGRIPFELPPRGSTAFVFRALTAASGQSLSFAATGTAVGTEGRPLRLEGPTVVDVAEAQ